MVCSGSSQDAVIMAGARQQGTLVYLHRHSLMHSIERWAGGLVPRVTGKRCMAVFHCLWSTPPPIAHRFGEYCH